MRHKCQADRVKAVIALSKGWSAAKVAEILLFDEKTSRHYFERYRQGGLHALLDDNYFGAELKLNEHQIVRRISLNETVRRPIYVDDFASIFNDPLRS